MEPGTVFRSWNSARRRFFAGLDKKLPGMTGATWKDELISNTIAGIYHAGRYEAAIRPGGTLLMRRNYRSLAFLYGRPYPQEGLERA